MKIRRVMIYEASTCLSSLLDMWVVRSWYILLNEVVFENLIEPFLSAAVILRCFEVKLLWGCSVFIFLTYVEFYSC